MIMNNQYYYKIVFTPNHLSPCCVMRTIYENKEVFNIPYSRLGALKIDGVYSISIYFEMELKRKEYLDFVYILRNLFYPYETGIKYKFIKSYNEYLFMNEY